MIFLLTWVGLGCRHEVKRPYYPHLGGQTSGTQSGYWVSVLKLNYAQVKPDGVPTPDALRHCPLPFGDGGNGMELGDVGRSGAVYLTRDQVRTIQQAIVRYFNGLGYGAVAVMPRPGQIDPTTLKDLRDSSATEAKPLVLTVWVGVVREVRAEITANREYGGSSRMKDRIMAFSPVSGEDPNHVETGREPLKIDAIQEYVYRLNRTGSRHVSAAIKPSGEAGKVDLVYQVKPEKPWLGYGQVSNTGTKQSGRWRNRVGFLHDDLTGRDDRLSVDYMTSNFSDLHSVAVSYEFPLWGTLDKRVRVFGSQSEYRASELGEKTDFEGWETGAGAELQWPLWQKGPAFLDGYVGLDWNRHHVENRLVKVEGLENLLTGQAGLSYERRGAGQYSYGRAGLSWSMPELSGVGQAGLTRLGRMRPDAQWVTVNYQAEQRFYLDEIIDPNRVAGKHRLEHELAFFCRGQLTSDRLIPQERMSLGGLYSVRGYPQSVVSGDSVLMIGGEYRYHLGFDDRRLLMRRRRGNEAVGGENFWQLAGVKQWDCVLKAFCDAGQSWNSRENAYENDETLIGAGVGMEMWFNRRVNVRCDIGCPLRSVKGYKEQIEPGDVAMHLAATVSF